MVLFAVCARGGVGGQKRGAGWTHTEAITRLKFPSQKSHKKRNKIAFFLCKNRLTNIYKKLQIFWVHFCFFQTRHKGKQQFGIMPAPDPKGDFSALLPIFKESNLDNSLIFRRAKMR